MTDRDLHPTPKTDKRHPRRPSVGQRTAVGRAAPHPTAPFGGAPWEDKTPPRPPKAANPSAPTRPPFQRQSWSLILLTLRFIEYDGGYPILQFTFSPVLSDPAPPRRGDVG